MRLAFAVAAHLEPEILIVDEVLAVGDAEFQKKCLGKMDDVAAAGPDGAVRQPQHGRGAAALPERGLARSRPAVASMGPCAEVVDKYYADLSTRRTSLLDEVRGVDRHAGSGHQPADRFRPPGAPPPGIIQGDP